MCTISEFCKSSELYEDIPDVLHAVLVACVKGPIESITESMASKLKYHNAPERCLEVDTLNKELFVSWNGPEIWNADSVIHDALDRHFGIIWLSCTPRSMKFYKASETVDSLQKIPSIFCNITDL